MKQFLLSIAAVAAFSPVVAAQTTAVGTEVDMGVSVKWCSADLGTTDPATEAPAYAYAYTTTGNVDREDYKYYDEWIWSQNPYKFPVTNISGEEQYDAAAKATGGDWVMPTKSQWDELVANCTVSSDDNFIILTSKTTGNTLQFKKSTGVFSYYYYTATNNGELPYVATLSNSNASVALQNAWGYSVGPFSAYPIRPVRNAGPIAPESITITTDKTTVYAGTCVQISGTVYPADAKPNEVTFTSGDTSLATIETDSYLAETIVGSTLVRTAYGKSGKVTITATCGDVTKTVEITVVAVETDPTESVVDLGLSVKWCAYNLGATSPTEKGNKYAWAYITPATGMYQQDYMYADGLPAANICGNPQYDAVAANQATYPGQRMPSKDEFSELVNYKNTTYELLSNNCWRFVSNSNGKAIVMPVGEYWTGSADGKWVYSVSGSSYYDYYPELAQGQSYNVLNMLRGVDENKQQAGVDLTPADDDAVVTEVYTIDGRRVAPDATLAPGIYIARHSNGKSKKFIVR